MSEQRHIPFPSYHKWCELRGVPGELEAYEAHKRLAADHASITHCVKCKAPLTDANVHTEAGWQETQLSGLCEDCFDEVTVETDEETDEQIREGMRELAARGEVPR